MNKEPALLVASILLGGGVALLAGCEDPPPPDAPSPPPTSRPALDAPDPQGCVAGCGAADDRSPHLEARAYDELLARFAKESPAAGSPALETLLFHHHDARRLLAERGPGPLDPERAAFLKRELAREEAWIDVRVVDAEGVERVRLGRRAVPLDIKQHLHPERRERLQQLEISGTVRRVGLYHLWSRI